MIDVSGGDKIPRKGGPGITQSDLLVINKTDLAPLVGADLGVMERDAKRMRGDGPDRVRAGHQGCRYERDCRGRTAGVEGDCRGERLRLPLDFGSRTA